MSTSTDSSASDTATVTGGPNRLFLVFIVVAAVLLTLIMSILLFGSCSGEQFSPEKFRRRTFSFYQIPIAELQITPFVYENSNQALESYLNSKNLVPSAGNAKTQWHVVRFYRNRAETFRGDAAILTSYLDDSNEIVFGNRFTTANTELLNWSRNNPKLAKVFWPYVAYVARDDVYYLAPDLFEIVDEHRDPTTLDRALKEKLLADYHKIAKTELAVGESSHALKLLDRMTEIDPPAEGRLRELRIEALKASGELGEAAKERERKPNSESGANSAESGTPEKPAKKQDEPAVGDSPS